MASIANLKNPPSRDTNARDRTVPKIIRRDYERFLETVRCRRQELGWSQAELGRRIGVSGPHVANLERGHSVPSVARLFLIAKALKVSPGALVSGGRSGRTR